MTYSSRNTESKRRAGTVVSLLFVLAASTAAIAATANWGTETILASDFAFAEMPTKVSTAVAPSGRAAVAWDKPLPSGGGIGFGGPREVFAAVRATTTGAWSTAARLSPPDISAANAGAVVDPSTGKVTVAWTSGGLPYVSSSSDGGASWVSAPVPAAAGYNFLQFGNVIDTDSKGNITLILFKQQPSSAAYDVAAITRSSDGTWRSPRVLTNPVGVTILSAPHLNVISDGRALLNVGATTFRRSSNGNWALPQTVGTAGLDIVDTYGSDIDGNGRGYFMVRGVAGGNSGVYLSTSSQSGSWTALRRIAALDSINLSLQVTASASGRALISGSDGQSHVRASVTSDGGMNWTLPADFGVGLSPYAAGSESGLYSVAWTGLGTNGYGTGLASGSGVGSGAWTQTVVGTTVSIDTPRVALAGKSGSNTARAVAGWERGAGVGASTAVIVR